MTTYNIQAMAGDSIAIEVTVVDQDGDAVDLTGAAISYVIKSTAKAATDELLLTTTDGSITVAANVFTVTSEPSDTDLLEGAYYQECEIILADGRVFTSFTGNIYFSPSGV